MLIAGETVVLFLQIVSQLALPMIEESRTELFWLWWNGSNKEMCRDYSLFSCTFRQVHRLNNYVAIGSGNGIGTARVEVVQNNSVCLQHLHCLNGMGGAGK